MSPNELRRLRRGAFDPFRAFADDFRFPDARFRVAGNTRSSSLTERPDDLSCASAPKVGSMRLSRLPMSSPMLIGPG
ncbi:hypothetical protein [Mesorhizobium sp. 1B3]|uniref:hypothetical protein n=1 Tax=Mesorhizobium sp. 1B3 TaxID=3243599 RepID=UPI003D9925D1